MKTIKSAKIIMLLAIVYWLIYNTYFGWNLNPINETELNCDLIFENILYVSIGMYISPLLNHYEKFIEKAESTVKTK